MASSSRGKFIFFDTETDAIWTETRPKSQTLMQLSWVVTDSKGKVLVKHNRFVKGATRVGEHAPLTLEYVNEHGDHASVVVDEFLKDARNVVSNGGHLIAHNADFDIGVLEHVHGALESALKSKTLCTMKDPSIKTYVGIPNNYYGGFKWPKLPELYKKLFGKEPREKLHDALGDTHVLRKCFLQLLRIGVVSLTTTEPRTMTKGVISSPATPTKKKIHSATTTTGNEGNSTSSTFDPP